jgi:hypothetical protein
MAKTAFSVDGLNPAGADPPYDYEERIVRYGDQMVNMRWIPGSGKWVESGAGRDLVQLAGVDGMMSGGAGFEGKSWDYLKFPVNGAATLSFSWAPQAIYNANLAWNAGLRLQEKILHTIFAFNVNDDWDAGVVYYGFADGDLISPLISVDDTSPGRNLGEPVASLPGLRRFRGGWVDVPIDQPTAIVAPHIYVRATNPGGDSPISNCYVQQFDARWRWVGTPS